METTTTRKFKIKTMDGKTTEFELPADCPITQVRTINHDLYFQ